MEILLHGTEPYINDIRYTGIHDSKEDVWILRIEGVRKKDGGVYECQLSSLPVISHTVNLLVLDTKVDIVGDEELYVQTGSSLTLVCVVENAFLEGNRLVVWNKGKSVIKKESLGKSLKSDLTIDNAETSSEGVYECKVPGVGSAHIYLHVLDRDRIGLLQTSSAVKAQNSFSMICKLMLTTVDWIFSIMYRSLLQ